MTLIVFDDFINYVCRFYFCIPVLPEASELFT